VTSATLPDVADMSVVPVASGAGRSVVPPPPAPSFTRKYWPGASVHVPGVVEAHRLVTANEPVVEVAVAYCADQAEISMLVLLRLWTSMKSFL